MVAWSTGSPIATVFRAMIQAGLDLPVGTTGGNMTYAQMNQFADILPKELYLPAPEWPIGRRPENRVAGAGRGEATRILRRLRRRRREAR